MEMAKEGDTQVLIRPMKKDEEITVAELLDSAFKGPDESTLVKALREEAVMVEEMVLELDGKLVGYYALSKMIEPSGWLCLAPVAVAPSHQRRGLGTKMMAGLTIKEKEAKRFVVVLGQVSFYEAAGFSAGRASKLSSPYPIKNTMLLGPGDDCPERKLVYPKAFGAS